MTRMKRLLALLTALVAFAGCAKREIPTTKPLPSLTAWVSATGKSMLPTFPERALVEIEMVPFEALKAGDTVIFWDYTVSSQPSLIHHRLVEKQAGSWIAKGDNPETNPRADKPWVTQDNYLARTTGRHTQLLFP